MNKWILKYYAIVDIMYQVDSLLALVVICFIEEYAVVSSVNREGVFRNRSANYP